MNDQQFGNLRNIHTGKYWITEKVNVSKQIFSNSLNEEQKYFGIKAITEWKNEIIITRHTVYNGEVTLYEC